MPALMMISPNGKLPVTCEGDYIYDLSVETTEIIMENGYLIHWW